MPRDNRGVNRGGCGCGCVGYQPPLATNQHNCENCGHRPTSHFDLDARQPANTSAITHAAPVAAVVQRHAAGGRVCRLQGCNKLCYVDPSNVVFDYCGRTHARLGANAHDAQENTCALPGCTAKVYKEHGTTHNYCTRTHAVQHANMQGGSAAIPARDRCSFPGCNKRKFRDEDGSNFDYCGRLHAYAMCFRSGREQLVNSNCVFAGCTKAKYTDGAKVYDFCGRTHAAASRAQMLSQGICVTCRSAPAIQPSREYEHCPPCWMNNMSVIQRYHERDLHVGFLPHASEKFIDLSRQFVDKWKHPTGNPNVVDILVFLIPQTYRTQYYQYRTALEQQGNFTAQSLHPGNEHRRFHGTKQKCDLGRNGISTPCKDRQCNVCNIIRTAFLLEMSGSSFGNFGFGTYGRFGKGIYFTSTSSKSNDYNEGSTRHIMGQKTKAMFAVKVSLGKGKKYTQDAPELTEPPAGYDSVLGETGQGSSLNYDECVVYDQRAALPAYLIIYTW